mmetsp:Transcript_91001/g.161172  ORF Transcript_91001/g.161172 Transcript_91001/m.161172 type:complete len:298 (+) Transcript_91001:115-1008(+)
MAGWAAPVLGVVAITLLILLFLSFDTLDYQEVGLNYSLIRETVEDKTWPKGRYYLGLGNHFIKFPRNVNSVYFLDVNSKDVQGPALQSRTKDGLTVYLEISFQYKLKPEDLYQMYTTLGENYQDVLIRMAIEQLTTAATKHVAYDFFTNRTGIADEMHRMLASHFEHHGFSYVPFFQLRTVRLPPDFEKAIEDTQVKEQEIKVAQAVQATNRVSYETRVVQAEQQFKILQQQAAGQANSTIARNDAWCQQYRITQMLQAKALSKMKSDAGWTSEQLLEYLRIRAVRDHPSENTMVNL